MATGMAKGAKARGKRIAFGDGKRFIWDHNSEQIFRGNKNIAAPIPGTERDRDLEWIAYYRGNRLYNRQEGIRWVWNYDFRAKPGEIEFSDEETEWASRHSGYVIIEPNVPEFKTVATNKQWPVHRYQAVADQLAREGYKLGQFYYPNMTTVLDGVTQIKTKTFRHAAAVLKNSALYIGPEGGLHHAAAAVSVPAVVLFGGFIPPQVTGYRTHTNLTGGAKACGMLRPCTHCKEAMQAIGVADVLDAVGKYLKVAA